MPPVTAILFIGDVVARPGRRIVRDLVPELRAELGLDFVVANGENAAGGIGITPKEADELFAAGVDVITLVNLSGNLFMQAGSPALVTIDDALREVAGADHVLVDMHAEATSEKIALGWYLDGKVTAVVGTHTHVPTADARVLPGGTAYVTDVGMTGARGGVIGVRREQSIAVMRTHMPQRYDPADEDPWINAVLIRTGADGRAQSIEPVIRPLAGAP